MTDTILGGEISEFVANRQYAKIQYLQEENKQLQEQLKDMEKALKLNKEVLRLTLEQNLNNSNNSTNSSEQIQTIQLQMKLHEENEMLRNQMSKLTDERNIAQNKVLLSQQISEENQAFYKDLIVELEEKLGELRRCIQDKEYTIQDIEKNRGLNDNGQMVKIREIVTPHEQSLRLHEELESTRQILNKLSQESQHLQEQNKLLKDINQNFKRELIKLRIILRSPLAYYKMKNFIYNDDPGDSADNLQLHEEIFQNQPFNQPSNEAPPQNQFRCVCQQQLTNTMKYLTNNERANYQEKIQKTETLLKGFKELFEKEKNKVALLVQLTDSLEKKINECYNQNELIIKGISSRDQKIEQLQAEVQYYRTQYGNYIHFLKNKRKINLNLSFQLKEISTNLQPTPPPIQNTNNKILSDFEKGPDDTEQHISILEDPVDDQSPDIKKSNKIDGQSKVNQKLSNILEHNYSQMNQLECKQLLLNTAKDLYLNYNLKMNNFIKKQLMDPKKCLKAKPIWHLKSSSDPLDYFTLQYQNLQISGKSEFKQNDDLANFLKKKQPKAAKEHEKNNWDFLNDFSMIQGEKNKQILSENYGFNEMVLN
ncbi:unnamed protein product [Paramecium primaurelia]|uniref:Uncharacterized protein n=1 Tax=Paramecium primaurelia TaxID=5886 RepID=A0A8S1K270_PARPR|nr:unnamed protein product [Paramecium primaurelia]